MAPTADYYLQSQKILEDVVRGFRPILMAAHGNVEQDIKSDNTPVTVLDRELEELLRAALVKFDPSVPIVGEEYGGEIPASRTHWLVDPIDGTENFVRGLPFVRNMVTLIDSGQPVFAFVYKPVTDELFIAAKNHGTTKNGQTVHVSNRPLSRAWIELSTSLQKPESLALVHAVRQQINGYRILGEFTYLVEGKLDAQIVCQSGGGPWDYAPRALMVSEAGGRVANFGSTAYDYQNPDMLMANPVIFDDLMRIINQHT